MSMISEQNGDSTIQTESGCNSDDEKDDDSHRNTLLFWLRAEARARECACSPWTRELLNAAWRTEDQAGVRVTPGDVVGFVRSRASFEFLAKHPLDDSNLSSESALKLYDLYLRNGRQCQCQEVEQVLSKRVQSPRTNEKHRDEPTPGLMVTLSSGRVREDGTLEVFRGSESDTQACLPSSPSPSSGSQSDDEASSCSSGESLSPDSFRESGQTRAHIPSLSAEARAAFLSRQAAALRRDRLATEAKWQWDLWTVLTVVGSVGFVGYHTVRWFRRR
eukprot:412240_1